MSTGRQLRQGVPLGPGQKGKPPLSARRSKLEEKFPEENTDFSSRGVSTALTLGEAGGGADLIPGMSRPSYGVGFGGRVRLSKLITKVRVVG